MLSNDIPAVFFKNRRLHKGAVRCAGILIILISLIASTFSSVVRAQDTPCAGLGDKDCELLMTALLNLAQEKSFSYEGEFNTAETFEQAENSQYFKSSFSGQFEQFGSVVRGDPAATLDGIKWFIDVSGVSTPSDKKTVLRITLLDKTIYYDYGSGVRGYKIDKIYSQGSGLSLAQALQTPDAVRALTMLFMTPNLITANKSNDNPEFDGQKQVEFKYNVDVKSLSTSQALQRLLSIKQVAALNPMFANQDHLKMIIEHSTLTLTTWIGQNDKFFHGFGFEFHEKIDPKDLDKSDEPTAFTVQFMIRINDIGKSVNVTAPENAQIVSP